MNWVKLGDIFKITSGGTPQSGIREYYENGTIPWVKTGDLKIRHLINIPERITEAGLQNSSAKLFPVNTVLIAMYGATIGACSILKIEAATNQACAALLPNENVDEEFLYFYLKSIQSQLIRKGLGGGQSNISIKIIKEILFPLIPIEAQRKFAQILSRGEGLITVRLRTLNRLDGFLQSTFYDFFGDPVLNEKNWKIKNIGDIITNIVAGSSYGGKERPLAKDELGVLKISAVTSGTFKPTEFKAIPKAIIKKPVIFPRRGDLLFSRANTRELVGATCVVDKDYDNVFLPDKLWRVDISKNECTPHYLNFLLANNKIKTKLTSIATGTSGSMLNISMKKLKAFQVPVAPLALQIQFSAVVEQVEKLKTQQQTSLAGLQTLYQSLLQAAFQGKLEISQTGSIVPADIVSDNRNSPNESIWQKLETELGNQPISLKVLQSMFPEADYPKLRELVFNAIDEGHLVQVYDTDKRAVQMKAQLHRP